MLDADQLVDLYRAYRDHSVLSVYLDADQSDPAERGRWRIALKNGVSAAQDGVDDPEAFESALDRVEKVLDVEQDSFLSGRGWVGFATADEVVMAESLPVPMPDLVRWEKGLRVAPYVRVLKQSRPVWGVLVDSRKARLVEYRMGRLDDRDRLTADTFLGDLTDVTVSKRASGHSGNRGVTGSDAAQRFLEVERDRLLSRVEDEIRSALDGTGVVVVGGADRAAAALAESLSYLGDERLLVRPQMHFDLTDDELRRELEVAASELSQRRQASLVQELLDRARSGGDACLGSDRTRRALLEKRVDRLVVSDRARRERSDLIDRFEGTAFEQGATLVEVSREAAARLDEECDGIGAFLRYRLPSDGEPDAAEEAAE